VADQPTEPAALTAASLLAASTVEEQGSVWAGHAQLSGLVQRAAADHDVGTVLEEVTARPQDPSAIGALAQVLAAVAAEDPTFRGELARLVGQAEHDPAIGQLATTIAGHARVGKVVTIGHAGAVHVHLPPPPPQALLDRLHRTTTGRPLVANLPPRNPAFTGRDGLLDQLHASLHPGQAAAVVQAQALHGLGGVGKTQLALEYAYAHAADYDLIWWITAEQPAAIPGQLVALARRLAIPEAIDQAETIAVLYDELRGRDRWLLIFDNAEDPAELRRWWPPDSGRVLVTSRNPAWGGLAAAIPLDAPPRSEAIAFLRRRLGRDDPAFAQLAQELGDLPLALEQAAAYLDETAIGVGDYLGLLGGRARELFALGRPTTTEHTVATTWTVSLDHLRTQTPAAEDLLSLCAFMAADDIPRALPTQHADLLPQRLAAAVQDPLAYQQTIAALRRHSLVIGSDDALRVHRLVQAVTRDDLAVDEQQQWASIAGNLILAGFPEKAGDSTDTWPISARLVAHALMVTSYDAAQARDPQIPVILLNRVGDYLWGRAHYRDAERHLQQAVTMAENLLGPDHPITADSLHILAHVSHNQGNLDLAQSLHERALSIREKHPGADHPTTAHSLHNLAQVLHDQGDLDRAHALGERALAINEARLGADHLDTAASLNNLATVLRDQGDLNGARSLHERALAIWENNLGVDHTTVAWCLNDLAQVLHHQGELANARALYERALAIRETRLGPDHPDTAHSLNNLAAVLADQGDLDAARTLHERALAIREARLGADHPDTVRSRENLAAVVAMLDKQR
jgi:tetratricopeptide (TPR) repeat protein